MAADQGGSVVGARSSKGGVATTWWAAHYCLSSAGGPLTGMMKSFNKLVCVAARTAVWSYWTRRVWSRASRLHMESGCSEFSAKRSSINLGDSRAWAVLVLKVQLELDRDAVECWWLVGGHQVSIRLVTRNASRCTFNPRKSLGCPRLPLRLFADRSIPTVTFISAFEKRAGVRMAGSDRPTNGVKLDHDANTLGPANSFVGQSAESHSYSVQNLERARDSIGRCA